MSKVKYIEIRDKKTGKVTTVELGGAGGSDTNDTAYVEDEVLYIEEGTTVGGSSEITYIDKEIDAATFTVTFTSEELTNLCKPNYVLRVNGGGETMQFNLFIGGQYPIFAAGVSPDAITMPTQYYLIPTTETTYTLTFKPPFEMEKHGYLSLKTSTGSTSFPPMATINTVVFDKDTYLKLKERYYIGFIVCTKSNDISTSVYYTKESIDSNNSITFHSIGTQEDSMSITRFILHEDLTTEISHHSINYVY